MTRRPSGPLILDSSLACEASLHDACYYYLGFVTSGAELGRPKIRKKGPTLGPLLARGRRRAAASVRKNQNPIGTLGDSKTVKPQKKERQTETKKWTRRSMRLLMF